MNIEQFVSKVREMRKAQKDYFKGRMTGDLMLAKRLEREVDEALAEGVSLRAAAPLHKGWKERNNEQ